MSSKSREYSYYAYGLHINSDVELTELAHKKGNADVKIRLGDLSRFNADRSQNYTLLATPNEFCRNWRSIGTFYVENGCRVTIDPDPAVKKSSLSPFITGPIMACVLHQLGTMVLHSSAVSLKEKGIAFLAESGVGKSTLAAFLQKRGAALITDDILPVYFEPAGVKTVAGYAQLRLWTDSLDTLGVEAAKLKKVNEFVEKRFYPITQNLDSALIDLKALYVIYEGDEIGIERMNLAEAFIEIVRNSYLSRYIDATERTADHFKNCEKLIKTLPVFKLTRPKNYEVLPQVAEMIEEHACSL